MSWTGNSNPVPSNLQALITSDSYTINSTSTTVTLLAESGLVDILGDASVDCYVNFRNSTATSSNAKIAAGSSYRYKGAPIIAFQMITATGTGTVQIVAS